MFIVFCIFIANIYTYPVHSFTLRTKHNDNVDNDNSGRYTIFDDSIKNEETTQSDWQKFIQNLTYVKQKSNLKSNVFDRMLSEEMLSLKEHFQKKDMTEVSPVQVTTGSYRPKPTLEVKQQWSVLKRIAKLNEDQASDDEENETIPDNLNTETALNLPTTNSDTEKGSKVDLLKPKSLGLRSLPNNQRYPQNNNNRCVCQKQTPERTVTGNMLRADTVHTQCTSSTSCDSSSRADVEYYPMVPIFTVPPYVIDLGDISNDPNHGFQPSKKGKQKNKGSKKKFIEKAYYDENEYDNSDSSDSKSDDDGNSDYDIDGVDENLVNSIVNDLGVYHRDSVVKKCYCSSISKSVPDYLSVLFIFIYLLKVWIVGV